MRNKKKVNIFECLMNGIISLARIYKVKPDKVEGMLSDMRYYINSENNFEKLYDEEDFD